MPDGRRAAALLVLSLAAAAAICCAGSAARQELEAMPETDLAGFEEPVRAQLGAASEAVARAAAGGDDGALATAYGELGRRLHAYELHEAAAAAYRNAVRLAPDEFRWLYHLGILYQATGELDRAGELLAQALERRPDDLPARVRLGEIRIAQADPAAARAELERALEADPDCALAHFFLGNLANAAGDAAEAARRYERALEIQPGAAAVHAPLAAVYQSLGDGERAATHLARRGRQVVQLLDPMALALGELHVGAVGRIRRGARAQIEGDLQTARAEYAKAVAADPANPEARQSLGAVLAELGETGAAVAEYRTALELTGENALVLANLGALLLATPDRAEGVGRLERALELDPTLARARLALAQARVEQGRPDLAETLYRGVLERDAANLPARLGLSRALAAAGRVDAAAAELERALARDPAPGDAAAVHQELASLAAARGDRDEALARLERALELDPGLAGARFSRANLLGIAGRYREAAAEYSRFLAQRPASVPGYLGRATAQLMAGDLVAAGRGLDAGLAATGRNPNLMHALARLLVTAPEPAARDPQRGLELSRQALARLGSPEAAATVGLALAAAGRCAEAAEHERRLLDECRRTGNEALAARLRPRLDHFEATGRCLDPWSGGPLG